MYKMVGSVWRLISCYFRLLLYCTVLLADRTNGRGALMLQCCVRLSSVVVCNVMYCG